MSDIKEINVQNPWFDYIKSGEKRIEGRLNKGTFNNKFINDLFLIDKNNENYKDFIIDLEILIKFLDVKKGTIKDTLKNSYTKNIDYKITKEKKMSKNVGKPKEIIMLTPDCFKRLTMSSKTKKAEEVRTYFIQLEKHIDKYKNYIIDGMNKKIE